jgi:tetratricopeptide (TPR) repeat protein
MLIGLLTVAALAMPDAQTLLDVRHLYDAGKFGEVVTAVEQASAASDATLPRLRYLAAQSREKLNDPDKARQIYQLLSTGADSAWAEVGRSALAAMDKRPDDALASANLAVEQNATLPEAHYQRGIVLMLRRQYDEASGAFDKAITLDGSYAAAHYYGGLSDYRAKRIDRMAKHFEAFLKLAPDAPERVEVESIMRTVRGR